jgi:YidC/Oxa1 family membrane protein insertase
LPDGLFLTIFFQFKRCDLCVLTVMDLDNLNLKRSINGVHYLYVFHSMGSTHMVDHANSFDAYDTLFCAGPHQVAEIRRREQLKNLKAKNLFDYGHPRLEAVMAEQAQRSAPVAPGENPTILIAPTWGETSIFNTCGERLIDILLGAGFRVIMRPHYQSVRQSPGVIASIRAAFESHERFEYVDQMGEMDSVLRSHLLVSDWSAMALEYALGLEKPVLFIDVERRIRNPDWRELGIEPVESSIRARAGAVLDPAELEQAPEMIRRLLDGAEEFRKAMPALREEIVFRLGHAIPDGAKEIARLADGLAKTRNDAHGP